MAGEGATWEIGAELRHDQWLTYLERFAPYHIEFAGGEPTLYRSLVDFVKGMPEGCTWAITTNGAELPPWPAWQEDDKCARTCHGYSISLHLPYSKRDKLYTNRILSQTTELNRRGFGYVLKFSIVITPDTIEVAEYLVPWLHRWGYAVHFNQAALTDIDWEQHPDVLERMRKLAGEEMIEYPWRWGDFPIYQRCTAGDKRYFFVMPDGQVLRCHSQIYWKDSKPIGHISTWQPQEGMKPCGKPHLWVCDDRSTEKE